LRPCERRPFQGPRERDEPDARAAFTQELTAQIERDDHRKARVVHVHGEGAARVDVAAAAIRTALETKRAAIVEALTS
jgi:hypothetical protein